MKVLKTEQIHLKYTDNYEIKQRNKKRVDRIVEK